LARAALDLGDIMPLVVGFLLGECGLGGYALANFLKGK